MTPWDQQKILKLVGIIYGSYSIRKKQLPGIFQQKQTRKLLSAQHPGQHAKKSEQEIPRTGDSFI